MSSSSPRHSLATRLFHASLAGAVIVQLLSSVWMHRPRGTSPGNILFPIHEYAGMLALVLAFLFWVTVLSRRVGTAPGALLPWFSAERLRALRADVGTHLRAARAFTLPPHQDHAALPSAIHGLGLLLISYMAVSGTYWYLMSLAGLGRSAFVQPFMELHGLLGNVVWAYLIGHAALALLHHVTKNLSLGVMWSVKS